MKTFSRSVKVTLAHFANLHLFVAMNLAMIWCENKLGGWCLLIFPFFVIPLFIFMDCTNTMQDICSKKSDSEEILWIMGAGASLLGVIASCGFLALALGSNQSGGQVALEWFKLIFMGSLLLFALPSLYILGQSAVLAYRNRSGHD